MLLHFHISKCTSLLVCTLVFQVAAISSSVETVDSEGLSLFYEDKTPEQISPEMISLAIRMLGAGLPLYYWYEKARGVNFGDYLSLKLVERIIGENITVYQKPSGSPQNGGPQKKLLAIGSILTFARDNDVIWGSGANGKWLDLKNYKFTTLDVRALRGPLTRDFLIKNFNISCPEVYGEPALLIPYFFPEFKRKEQPSNEYLIIPHYSEQHLFPKSSYPNVIYPTDHWETVMEKILDSKFVISGSLHGVVVAEAFGIPARLLRITENEPIFKFMDYYLGTGRPDFKIAYSLEEALSMGGEPPAQCDLAKLYSTFPFEFWPHVQFQKPNFKEKQLLVRASTAPEPIDLEMRAQNFVLETKQITIPGFPGAFNASIIRWRGSLLLCFRVRDEKMVSTFQMGCVWLDEQFNPVGTPRILDIRNDNPACFAQKQDPRLISIGEKLYILYSDFIKIDAITPRRMFIAEVQHENGIFFIDSPVCLHPFDGWSNRWEKNWVPFIYHKHLLLAYSIFPHRIFKPFLNSGKCITHSITDAIDNWSWGEPRGGTPAVRDGDKYIAFFHSSIAMASTYSQGKKMSHYVMGAYTFSAKAPFQVTHISPEPIIGKNFYSGPTYNTWKPLRAVFPMGCLLDGEYIWVTYGRQDFEIWIAKIDKKALYNFLVPCPPAETVREKYADKTNKPNKAALLCGPCEALNEIDYQAGNS